MLLGVIMILGWQMLSAQTFGEWFRQKKTQTEYLVQQIAALQVYKGYLKAGYNVVSGGLHLIKDVREGEFDLHKKYFTDLEAPGDFVLYGAEKIDLKALSEAVLSAYRSNVSLCRKTPSLSVEEKQSIIDFCVALKNKCDMQITELEVLQSSGALKLTEFERNGRLEKVKLELESLLAASFQVFASLTTDAAAKSRLEDDLKY